MSILTSISNSLLLQLMFGSENITNNLHVSTDIYGVRSVRYSSLYGTLICH